MPASTRSGNPAKKAAAKRPADRQAPAQKAPPQISSAEEWGSDDTEILEFPSGKVARIERVPLTTLIAENLLGDSLSAIAAKAVDGAQGMDSDEIRDMAQDPAKVAEAFDAFDKITVKCFIEPEVLYYKGDDGTVIPRDQREAGRLYSDRIDLQDKVYLFQVISGGTSDLQRFREQLGESVAGVSAS